MRQELPSSSTLHLARRAGPFGVARARARFDTRRRGAAAVAAVAVDRRAASDDRGSAVLGRAFRARRERDRAGAAARHRRRRGTLLPLDDRLPVVRRGEGAGPRLVARSDAPCARRLLARCDLRARRSRGSRARAPACARRRSHRSARRCLPRTRARRLSAGGATRSARPRARRRVAFAAVQNELRNRVARLLP